MSKAIEVKLVGKAIIEAKLVGKARGAKLVSKAIEAKLVGKARGGKASEQS